MTSQNKTPNEDDIRQFLQASLSAVVRAEVQERVPARFTGAGVDIWKTFSNELDSADLIALAIKDAGMTMPVPFEPRLWWPDWPDWAMLRHRPVDAEPWVQRALQWSELSRSEYLRRQAAFLEVVPPDASAISDLPRPAPYEQWLELPGTGGWISYALCQRPDNSVYYWENFSVICGTPQEMHLAGLIAWELGAPPSSDLPIRLDDQALTATLKTGETYDAVVGRRDMHGHRDLRVLLDDEEEPIWV